MQPYADQMMQKTDGGCFLAILDRHHLEEVTSKFRQERIMVSQVQGAKCRTGDALLREWGTSLHFPDYYGQNWGAMSECLRDREFVPRVPTLGVVAQAEMLLSKAPQGDHDALDCILRRIPAGRIESGYLSLPEHPYPPFWFLLNFSTAKDRDAFSRRLPKWVVL